MARRALAALAVIAVMAPGGFGPVARVAAQTSTPFDDTIRRYPGFGEYVPVDPVRVLDTRDGTGGAAARATAGVPVVAPVSDPASVPDNAWAVAVNITVIGPDADGFLTAVALGAPFTTPDGQPIASNVNFRRGQTVPNAALVGVFGRGAIVAQINAGTADLAVDVVGYVIGGDAEARGSRLTGVAPRRILDTRSTAPIAANAFVDVAVPGLPADASGVAINVTATEGTEASYLTVYAAATAVPNASSVTVAPGVTRPNLVFSRLGPGATVRIYNYAGTVEVAVDLVGVFAPSSTNLTGRIIPRSTPYRGFDSRVDGNRLPLGENDAISLNYADLDTEVGAAVQSAIINVTATEGTADSFLNVYPATGAGGQTSGARAGSSVVNWRPGDVNPNLAIVTLGARQSNGARYVGVFNYAGIVHFVLDESAYVLA